MIGMEFFPEEAVRHRVNGLLSKFLHKKCRRGPTVRKTGARCGK